MIIMGDEPISEITKGLFVKSESIVKKEGVIQDIEILPEYQAIEDLLKTGNNELIFVTGKAGTGKSTFIRYIRSRFDKCIVVAPTAIAAANIQAPTIHSFFSLPITFINPEDVSNNNPKITPLVKSLDLLIIDEVSMVNAILIDTIDIILKKIKGANKPFGGISVLFVGDLFQLPPIVSDKEVVKFFSSRYGGTYFFLANVFEKKSLHRIELTKVFRQIDQEFIHILDAIRTSEEDCKSKLEALNEACYKEPIESEFDDVIHLVPTKIKAESHNQSKLDSISGMSQKFNVILSNGMTLHEVSNLQVPDVLELKVGAKVVFLKNNESHWINGSLGEVVELNGNDLIKVRVLDSGVVEDVYRETWGKTEYFFDNTNKKISSIQIVEARQFPLNLGWAITIHKSQGMTLDKVVIDIGGSAFADGQTYVALSRVKSMGGLRIKSKITIRDIRTNLKIKIIYDKLFRKSSE